MQQRYYCSKNSCYYYDKQCYFSSFFVLQHILEAPVSDLALWCT